MGAFSTSMRKVATDLIKALGNRCSLVMPGGPSTYDPATGLSAIPAPRAFKVHAAPAKLVNTAFGQSGINTNLLAFDDETVIVAWFGKEVDATWTFDGGNIKFVKPIRAQDEIIAFTITLGKKR